MFNSYKNNISRILDLYSLNLAQISVHKSPKCFFKFGSLDLIKKKGRGGSVLDTDLTFQTTMSAVTYCDVFMLWTTLSVVKENSTIISIKAALASYLRS